MELTEISCKIAKSISDKYSGEKKIIFEDHNGKTGGYLGSLLFGKIRTKNGNAEPKDVDIIVKYGKKDNVVFLKIAFHREALIYDRIMPVFIRFQKEKGIQMPFNPLPKCYQTIVNEDLEAIVLEDLRNSGYRLYERTVPMDIPHQKMILQAYAKMHALSFAIRDHKKEELESMKTNLKNVARHYFQEQSTRKCLFKYTKYSHELLVRRGETLLAKKLEEILENGPADIILDVLDSDVPECVITHGDGWINNFLFKYEENNPNVPTKLSIIDWQLASLHSPALDLSLLIYTSSSEKELQHFEEQIEVYHTTLTNFLRELGSSSEDLFSFSKLKEHWQRYSVFGFLWSLTFLRIVLSVEDERGEGSKEDMFDVTVKNQSDLDERLIALIKHHFFFKFK